MSVLLLYLLLLKATMTTFSGLGSLPLLREELVERRHVLTDQQLALAVAAGQSGPGPLGLYLVSVGYLVAGYPGAAAGWLAMVTPAFAIVPMLQFAGARARHRLVRRAVRGLVVGAAGLIVAAALPLARESLGAPIPAAIAAVSMMAAAFTRVDTVWIILASALAGLAGASI